MRTRKPLRTERLLALLEVSLRDHRGTEILRLDVRELTTVTDYLILASGTSDRQLRTLAERVRETAQAAGHQVLGSEGEKTGGWMLVDLGDIVVHLMLPEARSFYQLEKLWGWAEQPVVAKAGKRGTRKPAGTP
ncbi:MAG: ribosome silencing factor [Gammaproteobacteria bacterium]